MRLLVAAKGGISEAASAMRSHAVAGAGFERTLTPRRLSSAIPIQYVEGRSCTIGVAAYSSSGGDDIRLQLLCRARSRSTCVPLG